MDNNFFKSNPFLKHTYDKLSGDGQTFFDTLVQSPIDREVVRKFFHMVTLGKSDEELSEDLFHIYLINDLFDQDDQDESLVEWKSSLTNLGFTPEILQHAHKALGTAFPELFLGGNHSINQESTS